MPGVGGYVVLTRLSVESSETSVLWKILLCTYAKYTALYSVLT